MKKKLTIYLGIISLALMLTVGTFAYAYINVTTTTLDAALAGGEYVTSEPASEQPDWNEVLPWGEPDQEILIPEANGGTTGLEGQYPAEGEHWDKVDDIPADDGDSYVYTTKKQYRTDLYMLTDHMEGEGNINGISVYFRFSGDGANAKAAIKTYGQTHYGIQESQTGDTYTTKSYQWTTNPSTNSEWTWEEIDNLQVGVSLKAKKHGSAACTQVFVIIDYEIIITEGNVPEGNLFDITPLNDYTGDLLVKLYLTNTGDLLKAYQHLNMKIYIEGSLEAEQTPDYQILSLENGVALFNIEGGTADSYTIEVIGGGYRVLSEDPYAWGEGWTVVPELYCEVVQR
ncbi:hypothetical protein ACFLUZ_04800 [Chloroflexota bacterium]